MFYEMEPADYDEIEAERRWHESEMRAELAAEREAEGLASYNEDGEAYEDYQDEMAALEDSMLPEADLEDGFDIYAGQFEVSYPEDDLPF